MSIITEFVQDAIQDPDIVDEYDFGGINNRMCQRIAQDTGTRVLGNARTIITSSAVRHAFKRHGGKDENDRGQVALTPEDFDHLFDITRNPDYITKGDRMGRKRDEIIIFSKRIKGKNYFVLMNADRSKEPAALYFNTMYIKK